MTPGEVRSVYDEVKASRESLDLRLEKEALSASERAELEGERDEARRKEGKLWNVYSTLAGAEAEIGPLANLRERLAQAVASIAAADGRALQDADAVGICDRLRLSIARADLVLATRRERLAGATERAERLVAEATERRAAVA